MVDKLAYFNFKGELLDKGDNVLASGLLHEVEKYDSFRIVN